MEYYTVPNINIKQTQYALSLYTPPGCYIYSIVAETAVLISPLITTYLTGQLLLWCFVGNGRSHFTPHNNLSHGAVAFVVFCGKRQV